MFLLVLLLVVGNRCFASIRQLSKGEVQRIQEWEEDDNQNIWELSGQFEGDIVLSSIRNGLIDTAFRWPNREIPYEIDSVFDQKQRDWIKTSLKEFETKTCIRPRARTTNDLDYVHITGEENGCHSAVGRKGKQQNLNLQLNDPGKGCMRTGTIIHEFLHALGFYHQQSASSRDDFVTIVWPNIQEGMEHNFYKYLANETSSFGEEYDYDSIMHYSAYAFSKNNEKTILTKDPFAEIGQRETLSKTDIIKLHKMYGCAI